MASFTQRGAALITALLITAIAAAIATVLFIHQRVAISETELIAGSDRAPIYLDGAISWANLTLKKAATIESKRKLVLFPKIMPTGTIHGYTVKAILIDQQGLFNLNSITTSSQQIIFTRLLQLVEPQLTDNQAIRLTKNIQNWVTPDSVNTYYERLVPPYTAEHHRMVSVSELRMVEGFSAELYRKLLPFITALPTDENLINVNSAPAIILAALSPHITLARARGIIALRKEQGGFLSKSDFTNLLTQLGFTGDDNISNNIITTGSTFFLLHATAKFGNQTYNLFTLLKRINEDSDNNNDNNNGTEVKIVQQTSTL